MSGMGHITLRAGPVSYRIHCPKGPLVLRLGVRRMPGPRIYNIPPDNSSSGDS